MANILKHFSKAFEAYKRNFVPIILSILLVFITFYLFVGLGIFALFGTEGSATVAEFYMTEGGFTDTYSQELFEQINPQNFGLFLLFLILGGIVAVFLQAGLWGICFQGIKKKVNMKTFFTTIRERGVPYFFASILVGLIVSAILILLIAVYVVIYLFNPILSTIVLLLGIVLITPFFVLVSPAVISGKRVSSSLTESISLGKKNYFDLLLLIVLVFIFSLVSLVPILGIILVYFLVSPLFILVICSLYLEVSKSSKINVLISKDSVEIKTGKQKLKKSAPSKIRKSDREKKKTVKTSGKIKVKKKIGKRKK